MCFYQELVEQGTMDVCFGKLTQPSTSLGMCTISTWLGIVK